MRILDAFHLTDKVAIVTGGSSGLRVEFADALADAAICARAGESSGPNARSMAVGAKDVARHTGKDKREVRG